MTATEKSNTILKELSADIADEHVQRTKGSETHKGYDTTGYGYQTCVDRFNDVCGESWGYSWHIIREIDGEYSSGKPSFNVTVSLSIWVHDKESGRSCAGGHISATYADALKGAITNAFKKTAAFWGVGRAAYAGEIDDDNQKQPEEFSNRSTGKFDMPGISSGIKAVKSREELDVKIKYVDSIRGELSEKQRKWLDDDIGSMEKKFDKAPQPAPPEFDKVKSRVDAVAKCDALPAVLSFIEKLEKDHTFPAEQITELQRLYEMKKVELCGADEAPAFDSDSIPM